MGLHGTLTITFHGLINQLILLDESLSIKLIISIAFQSSTFIDWALQLRRPERQYFYIFCTSNCTAIQNSCLVVHTAIKTGAPNENIVQNHLLNIALLAYFSI